MPSAKAILLTLLAIVAGGYVAVWTVSLRSNQKWHWPNGFQYFAGALTNFFDTLGIGSFATTTALFRLRQTVADENLPGTLNIGHCLPTIVQAFIYVNIVEVDQKTLVLLISSAVFGAWVGAGAVIRLPRRAVQLGMGCALLLAAALLLMRLSNLLPSGGDSLSLTGANLIIGMLGTFILGALMMIGVGAYAPIMIMVSLLGMNPKAAFPIMMGSCAFLVPVGSIHYIKTEKYDIPAALGLTVGGIPAVLVAAMLVRELPLDVVRWFVVLIVLDASHGLIRSAVKKRIPEKRHCSSVDAYTTTLTNPRAKVDEVESAACGPVLDGRLNEARGVRGGP